MEKEYIDDQQSATEVDDDPELVADSAATDIADEVLYMRYKKLCAETAIKEHQAEIERLKKLKMRGELVNHATVCEAAQRLGSLTRAVFRRMIAELPPVLESIKYERYTTNPI